MNNPKELEQGYNKLVELLEVQGADGNWNYDDYMCGMFNGMELAVATLEGRDPEFRTLRVEQEPRNSDEAAGVEYSEVAGAAASQVLNAPPEENIEVSGEIDTDYLLGDE